MINPATDLVLVTCSSLMEAGWNDMSTVRSSPLDLYRININEHIPNLELYSGLLNDDESARAGRYHHKKDEERFIISRGLLRWLLAKKLGTGPTDIHFGKYANKKPFLAEPSATGVEFNVAHAGGYILIAIGDQPVGTDIEFIDEQFDFAEVMKFAFNDLEIKTIGEAVSPLKSFYTFWSRKESLLKATGKGITDDLSATSCMDGMNTFQASIIGSTMNWYITTFMVDPDHVGNVCFAVEHPISFYTVKSDAVR